MPTPLSHSTPIVPKVQKAPKYTPLYTSLNFQQPNQRELVFNGNGHSTNSLAQINRADFAHTPHRHKHHHSSITEYHSHNTGHPHPCWIQMNQSHVYI